MRYDINISLTYSYICLTHFIFKFTIGFMRYTLSLTNSVVNLKLNYIKSNIFCTTLTTFF
jgi:hypothetical protein